MMDLTPEEEAFREMEQAALRKKNQEVMLRAQAEAIKFVDDQHRDLALMTLRKAFEIGYRYGFADAWKERK